MLIERIRYAMVACLATLILGACASSGVPDVTFSGRDAAVQRASLVPSDQVAQAPIIKIGTRFTFVRTDLWTGKSLSPHTMTFVAKNGPDDYTIETERDGVIFNRIHVTSHLGVISNSSRVNDKPMRHYDFPLYPGKEWDTDISYLTDNNIRVTVRHRVKVEGVEYLTTPIGRLKVWKVVQWGTFSRSDSSMGGGRVSRTLYYSPDVGFTVREDTHDTILTGQPNERLRFDLVNYEPPSVQATEKLNVTAQ